MTKEYFTVRFLQKNVGRVPLTLFCFTALAGLTGCNDIVPKELQGKFVCSNQTFEFTGSKVKWHTSDFVTVKSVTGGARAGEMVVWTDRYGQMTFGLKDGVLHKDPNLSLPIPCRRTS